MRVIQFAVLWTVWSLTTASFADAVLDEANSSGPPPETGAAVPKTPEAEASQDENLMKELEAAAGDDKASLDALKGTDAAHKEAVQKEDPTTDMPKVVQGVVGNEANPSLSIILDTAFSYFTENNRFRQGGHAPTANGPAIQGAELAGSASIDPYFRVDMAFGLYHLHIEEIYATTTALPWNLQIRAGQFKSNVGRHNPTHLHSWHFVQHPLANEFMFGAEGLALPGVELSVLFPLPWYVELIGALQMGSAGAFRTGSTSFKDFIYPIRLVQFFDLNTVLGPSQSGADVGNRSYAYGADLMLKWRPIGQGHDGYRFVAWVTEGWFRQMEVPDDLWQDAGGYSDLIFGIAKRWETALRAELWRRISGANENAEVRRTPFGVNAVRGAADVSFMPSHFSRIRLQYYYERISGYDDNHAVMLQLEVSAGAHGAHKY